MAAPVAVVGWMTAVCVASGAALVALVPGWTAPDVAAGIAGPLLAASVTWLTVSRAARANPRGLTSTMMAGFLVKIVFFGVYVVVMLRGVGVAPVPFIATFTVYFVGLYAVEAVLMHRLFTRGASAAS
jgi:hypothetical protein